MQENLIRAASVALELVVRAQRLSGGEVPDHHHGEHLKLIMRLYVGLGYCMRRII